MCRIIDIRNFGSSLWSSQRVIRRSNRNHAAGLYLTESMSYFILIIGIDRLNDKQYDKKKYFI